MEIKQSATSLPKLSVKNISSSVLRASSATALKPIKPTSSFGIKNPGVILIQENQTDTKELTSTLVETNQTLVEIQKQLALDFAMRIAQEKDEVKKIRTARQKAAVAAEEGRLEKGIGKIGAAGSSIVSKVTAPVKSVFDKIKEFFSLIVTNIVLNKAFDWLQDENNRALIKTIFDWIGKAFVPALVTIIGLKVFKWVRRLYKLARFLLRIPVKAFSAFKKLFGLGGKATNKVIEKTATKTTTSAAQRAATKAAESKAKSELAKKITDKGLSAAGKIVTMPDGSKKYVSLTSKAAEKITKKPNIFQRGISAIGGTFNKIGSWTGDLTKKLVDPIIKFVLPNLPPKVQSKIGQAVASKGFKRFLPFANMLFAVPEAIGRAMSGDVEGALLSAAGAIPVVGWGALALDIYRSVDPEGYTKNIRQGMNKEEMDKILIDGMSAIGNASAYGVGPIGLSKGGSVPGDGPGNIDSVDAKLAPGEEVVKTSSAMLFRPLLKDINENAGRKYAEFSQAVNSLKDNSAYQNDVSREYSKVLEDFDKSLKKSIDDKKKKTRTPTPPPPAAPPPASPPAAGPAAPTVQPKQEEAPSATITPSGTPSASADDKSITPSKASIAPSMATPPNLSLPSSDETKFSFIDMPVQNFNDALKMPSLEKTATDVEVISPVNMINPYMMLTKQWYRIQMQ